MKKYLCLILCLLLILSGCGNKQPKIEKPVKYYYCKADVTYGSASSVISWEERESAGYEDNVFYLISRYLSGPDSSDFLKTFPRFTRLSLCEIQEESVSLCLSNELASLSGMELTLACAALTMTVHGITGRETVQIRTDSELLDGKQTLVFRYSDLLLLDDAWTTIPIEEPKQ